jgi:hypothetical protein
VPRRDVTFVSKTIRLLVVATLFLASLPDALAQRVRGELRLEVHDPRGNAVERFAGNSL